MSTEVFGADVGMKVGTNVGEEDGIEVFGVVVDGEVEVEGGMDGLDDGRGDGIEDGKIEGGAEYCTPTGVAKFPLSSSVFGSTSGRVAIGGEVGDVEDGQATLKPVIFSSSECHVKLVLQSSTEQLSKKICVTHPSDVTPYNESVD